MSEPATTRPGLSVSYITPHGFYCACRRAVALGDREAHRARESAATRATEGSPTDAADEAGEA
ncbi:hypothetical protein C472_09938 [Halorubrum tebenquichense DSM 14210]|uniref:Uncharacterized protein n=1 Tax=Halorubrum tebenquichense DSM 14210 TaxID=1227485 RepID=M0DRW0_9EURY|nr:hypothetical protein C472_09938 [Halorubrum tebenquichense DSM 14210]